MGALQRVARQPEWLQGHQHSHAVRRWRPRCSALALLAASALCWTPVCRAVCARCTLSSSRRSAMCPRPLGPRSCACALDHPARAAGGVERAAASARARQECLHVARSVPFALLPERCVPQCLPVGRQGASAPYNDVGPAFHAAVHCPPYPAPCDAMQKHQSHRRAAHRSIQAQIMRDEHKDKTIVLPPHALGACFALHVYTCCAISTVRSTCLQRVCNRRMPLLSSPQQNRVCADERSRGDASMGSSFLMSVILL